MMFLLYIGVIFSANQIALSDARKLYFDVASKKKSVSELSEATQNHTDQILLGYYAASLCLSADEATGAIAKLNLFNRGKSLLEKQLQLNPDSIDLRFLRLTIQESAPSFLGYHHNISEDRFFIISKLSKEKDIWFKQKISEYLTRK